MNNNSPIALVSSKICSPYISILIDTLGAEVTFKTYPKGSRIKFTNDCYLIRSGIVSVNRQSDDLLLGIYYAPSIRGYASYPGTTKSLYNMKIIESSEIAILTFDDLYSLISRYDLWEIYARHLHFFISMAVELSMRVLPVSAYEIIRLQLYELITEPESVRQAMTAELYIRSKTKLARSTIMKVISEMKSSGAIVIKRGYLIKIVDIPIKM